MNRKIFLFPDGRGFAIDPSLEDFDFFMGCNPDFRIESDPPPKSFIPNFKKLKVGKLETKIESARKILSSCDLCGFNCHTNRFEKTGRCGLMARAFSSKPFVHICQEGPINPTSTLKMFGCALKCIYCLAHDHIEGWQNSPELIELTPKAWETVEWDKANCLEFGGGNPTESLPGILQFLSYAPRDFSIPIVWNDHLFSSKKAIELLDGVVDVYLADFKFGSDKCSRKLSEADGYWETAKANLQAMMEQDVRIILRILVTPGHFCCHKKILEWLSRYREELWLSILDQFIPEYKAVGHPEIGRLTKREEIQKVERLVKDLGLRDVNKNPDGFWE